MREISLGHGYSTIVDDDDFEKVSQWKWQRHPTGYARRTGPGGKSIYLARLILDAPNSMEVDHINGNTLDNRRCNLRLATRKQNAKNINRKAGASGIRGVRPCGKKFRADIQVDSRRYCLGMFKTIEEAQQAYIDAVKRFHGEFANTGDL